MEYMFDGCPLLKEIKCSEEMKWKFKFEKKNTKYNN